MNKHRVLTRWAVVLAGGALAVLTVGPTAVARPDDDYLLREATPVKVCPLERLGDQFVRCDNLTGAGVAAPAFVPEQSSRW